MTGDMFKTSTYKTLLFLYHYFSISFSSSLYSFFALLSSLILISSIFLYLSSICYDLKLKGLSTKTTFVLSNTRELDRVPNIK